MQDPDRTDTRPTSSQDGLRVAVLGATGLVGREMTRLLEASRIPVSRFVPLASARPGRRSVRFRDRDVEVQPVSEAALHDVDLCLASAGGEISREWLPGAARAGVVCVDNTSAFRMDADVPLVVPEVNAEALADVRLGERGAIIANPNCSTIQLVVALEPLRRAFGLERVIVSTYQSISGAGRRSVDAFRAATTTIMNAADDGPLIERDAPAFDVRARIGDFEDDEHSSEEWKMIRETPKILGQDVPVDVTCVRVPVFTGHAEAVLVETRDAVDVEAAERVLREAPGIRLHAAGEPPSPRSISGTVEVHIARVRPSRTFERGVQFWVVADNLLKGAAWNAIQIAETLARVSAPTAPTVGATS
jgi:aspartate-semialdehyde dehydrogenase